MNPPLGKTVALVNSLWMGHHPMYFTQFTASFLRCGANVIGFCPEPEAALRDLLKAVDPETAGDIANRVHFFRLPTGKRSFFNDRFEGDPVRTFARWRAAAENLAAAESETGLQADLVYFPYLDSYLRFLPFPAVPGMLLNRPWSGLYLRNHHHGEPPSVKKFIRMLAKGDAIFRSDFCRCIGVLDERFIPAMRKFSKIPITAYPDVTQANLPAEPYALALEIQKKAAGRIIIGMIGIERRKGFLTILRTAKLARELGQPYYFVCAGTVCLVEFTPEEQVEIQRLSDGIDNVYFDPHAGRIPSEADYNSLFHTFQIAWVAYEGFEGSSGTLGKAAAFGIPCIATAGECIGNRVESYRLGLTIPEANPEKALALIPYLVAGTDPMGHPLSPRFEDYRHHHSLERLDHLLQELLETV
jgi:glycosyltransferase involved in cell wall biosynthesis